MSALTTLPKFKLYTGESGTENDTLLTQLIDQVSASVEQFVGYSLLTASYDITLDGNGANAVFLPNRPITAVSALEINGVSIAASASYFDNGYVIEPKLVYLRNRVFTLGRRNVRIAYTAGYASVNALPADIVGVVNETVQLRFKERAWLGMKSKSLAGETTTFETGQFTKNAVSTLNSYKAVALS